MRSPTSLRLCRLHASPQSNPSRSSLSRHCNNFHTTTQPRFLAEALSSTLDSSSALLTQLHTASHLPWVLTLPLTALLVRVLITGPLSLYTRRAQQRQLAVQPLLSGWAHHLRHEVVQKYGRLGPVECEKRLKLEVYKKKRELYRRADCAAWKNWLPLTQLPVFLFVVEGVRRLCGTHDGLLGLLTKRFTANNTAELDENQAAVLDNLVSTEPSSPIDPTLATEGTLWFPNLLLPDPLLILPFLLSGIMFANIQMAVRSSRQTLGGAPPSKYQRRLTNTLKIIALAIGPLTLQLPAAMLVYWISSAGWALAQNALLEQYWPLKKPIRSCRLRNGHVIAGAPSDRGFSVITPNGGVTLDVPTLSKPQQSQIAGTGYKRLPGGKALGGAPPSKYQRRLTNTLRVLALAIGPLTLQLPSAMLVYWISSAGWALAQNALLKRYWPLKKPIRSCRLRNGNVIARGPK